jgi:hypothetical protein
MKKASCSVLIILLSIGFNLYSQVKVSGRVTDHKGLSLPGANVSIKGTYDGASADTAGWFSFSTSDTGKQILQVSYIGYHTFEQEIDLSGDPGSLSIQMEEKAGEISSVMITAGAFETGETKKPIVLKPMDIATTPSAVGDIYGALTTLPGAQVVGNEGGLYVRGGEGYETKTFIDGLMVANPYMSKMPDLPTRSRFSPILFTGTAFSTGGYSAEYGQALSSAINLNTTGMADQNQGAFSLMTVGMNGSYTHKWERTSFSGTLQYLNMQPYYSFNKQRMEWKKAPEQTGGTMLFRHKFGKYGMLKVFGSTDNSNSSLFYNMTGLKDAATLIKLENHNFYLNAVYNDMLSEKWRIKTGIAYGYDQNLTGFSMNQLNDHTRSFHHRTTFTYDIPKKFNLKLGEEAGGSFFNRSYFASDSGSTYGSGIRLMDYALYAEPEIRVKEKLVLRTGLRAEYLSLSNEWQLVPRISVAWHTGDYSQVSLACGMFRQHTENQILIMSPSLKSEKATHLILNYMYEVNDRIFRAEVYQKWYINLVRYESETNPDPATYNNSGFGFARGIDLFWRDSKTIRNLDYWVSWSWIDTKRNYKTYTQSRMPSFVSKQTFSIVGKYFIQKFNTYTGLTFMHASPKTWYNPYVPNSVADRTRSYNDLSLNITCIRPLLGTYCAFLININNIAGFNNVYGYNYTSAENGDYEKSPIKPQSKRFFVAGFYLIIK